MKKIGYILCVIAAISVFLGILALIDGSTGAFFGFLMFFAFFGFPGALLVYTIRKRERKQAFMNRFMGFIASYDRFTLTEMAQKIGKTELETEHLLAEAISVHNLALLFHRASHQYLKREKLEGAYKIINNCPNCGAGITSQVLYEGEQMRCPYCDSLIA